MNAHAQIRVRYASANRPADSAASIGASAIDSALLARKGYLVLLCTSDAGSDLVVEVRQRFYESTSFDVVPALAQALAASYRARSGAWEKVLAGIVSGEG